MCPNLWPFPVPLPLCYLTIKILIHTWQIDVMQTFSKWPQESAKVWLGITKPKSSKNSEKKKTYKSIYVFLKYNDTSYQIILKSFNSASKLCKFKRDGWLVKTMFFSQIELSPVYKEVSLYNTYIYFISILP